jgi:hypothetical protein
VSRRRVRAERRGRHGAEIPPWMTDFRLESRHPRPRPLVPSSMKPRATDVALAARRPSIRSSVSCTCSIGRARHRRPGCSARRTWCGASRGSACDPRLPPESPGHRGRAHGRRRHSAEGHRPADRAADRGGLLHRVEPDPIYAEGLTIDTRCGAPRKPSALASSRV